MSRRNLYIPEGVYSEMQKTAKSNGLSLSKFLISLYVDFMKGEIKPLPDSTPVIVRTVEEVRELYPDQPGYDEPVIREDRDLTEEERSDVEIVQKAADSVVDGTSPTGVVLKPTPDARQEYDSESQPDPFFRPHSKEYQTRAKKK